MTDKIDVKKTLDTYRAKAGEFRIVEVPDLQYLMVDGHGDPNTSPAFAEAIETLYPVAYALKFASKLTLGRDYVVPPLEGLWWADDMTVYTTRSKSEWDWTVMILAPEWIDAAMVDGGGGAVAGQERRPRSTTCGSRRCRRGSCVQTLHLGSFDSEAAGARPDARGVHPRARPGDDRQAPRDLPQRPPQGSPRQAPHDPAPARPPSLTTTET